MAIVFLEGLQQFGEQYQVRFFALTRQKREKWFKKDEAIEIVRQLRYVDRTLFLPIQRYFFCDGLQFFRKRGIEVTVFC
jgi:hypothetical protein